MPKHEHVFVVVHASRFGKVEVCLCGAYRTVMLDYNTGLPAILSGNFLCSLAAGYDVLILCGSLDEYRKIRGVLIDKYGVDNVHVEQLTSVRQLQANSIVFLYGTWYEHELAGNAMLTDILNGWI